MYRLLLFIHVGSAIGFLLFHGATASVMFALKRERDPARLQGLLALRDRAEGAWGLPMVVMIISGVILGFMGRWWSQGWIWASLGAFAVILFAMSGFGRMYIERTWHAIDPAGHDPPMKKDNRDGVPATREELSAFLATGRPVLLTVIGVGGLGLILWFMMFKPF